MASFLSSFLPGSGSSSTAAATNPGSSGTSYLRTLIAGGMQIPWYAHIFLTGILPFLSMIPFIGPFFFSAFTLLGSNGMNLLASNSMSWAAAKAASNLMCRMIADVMTVKFPGKPWMPYLRAILYYANPWVVFDMSQVFNPNFVNEGYKIPFWDKKVNATLAATNPAPTMKDIGGVLLDAKGKPVVGEDGKPTGEKAYGWIGAAFWGAVIVLAFPYVSTIISALPPEMQAKALPFTNLITTVIGGFAAVAGGGIGTFVLIPNMISGAQSQITALMSGGGGGDQKGEVVPSLQEVAESLLKEGGQSGGGEALESGLFAGVLSLIAFGGIVVGLTRLKDSGLLNV